MHALTLSTSAAKPQAQRARAFFEVHVTDIPFIRIDIALRIAIKQPRREWVEKGTMDFHAILALLLMWRGFRTATSPFVLPPGTPKDRVEILQEAMLKTFKDPEFRAEFQKLVSDEVSPLTPEELAKVIREMPRDPEVVEMLKKFSGVNPLPSR